MNPRGAEARATCNTFSNCGATSRKRGKGHAVDAHIHRGLWRSISARLFHRYYFVLFESVFYIFMSRSNNVKWPHFPSLSPIFPSSSSSPHTFLLITSSFRLAKFLCDSRPLSRQSSRRSPLPVRPLLMRLFTQYTLVKSDTSCNPFLLYSSIMWSVI